MQLTGFEQDDSSQTGVFSGIDVHLFEFGHCFLERLDLAEQAELTFGADRGQTGQSMERRRADAQSRHQRTGLDGQHELSGSEDEQFPPALLQQNDLVTRRKGRECRNALGPADVHEEETSGRFADGLRRETPRRDG